MAQRTGLVEVCTYLTPKMAQEVDRLREKEGGISRSAFVRSRFVKQLRYERWQERLTIRGESRSQRIQKARASRRSAAQASSSPPHEEGRFLSEISQDELMAAALKVVPTDPSEIDRVHARRTILEAGGRPSELTRENIAAVVPTVSEARKKLGLKPQWGYL